MFRFTVFALLILLSFNACKKDEVEKIIEVQEDIITFTGNWERSFSPIPNQTQRAEYRIYQDSIAYQLTGTLATSNYTLTKDSYNKTELRFIGHQPNGMYYVAFFKEIHLDTLMIYKQYILNKEEGLSIPIPADTNTQNYGWNKFSRF